MVTISLLSVLTITIIFILNKIDKLRKEVKHLESEIDSLEYERNYLVKQNTNEIPEIVESVLFVYETNNLHLPTDIIDTVINKQIWYNENDIFEEIERQRKNWKYECSKKLS